MSKHKYYLESDGIGICLRSIETDENVKDKEGKILCPTDKPALADYDFVRQNSEMMLGKVLTVIDASVIDGKQNKAVKDIIKNEFYENYSYLCEAMIGRKVVGEMSNLSDDLVIIQEKE